jgi:mono/diheme cytochrome c family protein
MRRPVLVFTLAIAAIGLFTGGLAWLLDTPRPPSGASRGERIYYALCVSCHGVTGRGSWHATLFLVRRAIWPTLGAGRHVHAYLFDLVRTGGAAVRRPGMPAFGAAHRRGDPRRRAASLALHALRSRSADLGDGIGVI